MIMTRLAIPELNAIDAAAKPLLDAVEQQLGTIPNLFRLLALSPAALEGSLALSQALNKTLDGKTRERIALAVAQVNGCDYCLSAHSYLAANVAHLDDAEISAARSGRSADPRAGAAVSFARAVAEARGHVSDSDIAATRLAGFTDGEIVDIVANVALNVLTNFVNVVAQTDIDFPVVRAKAA
jgi:uncharacterized peroxidase-related enzyme